MLSEHVLILEYSKASTTTTPFLLWVTSEPHLSLSVTPSCIPYVLKCKICVISEEIIRELFRDLWSIPQEYIVKYIFYSLKEVNSF